MKGGVLQGAGGDDGTKIYKMGCVEVIQGYMTVKVQGIKQYESRGRQ